MNTIFNFLTNKKLTNFLTYKSICLLMLLSFTIINSFAQQKKPKPRKPDPDWVIAMSDPNANYYRAVASFEAYWKNKEKPVEEEEEFATEGKKDKEEELRERRHKRLKANDPAIIYAYDYKRFQRWKEEMLPLVQSDGLIQSMDDRVNEWKVQQGQKRLQKQRDSQRKDGIKKSQN